MRKILKKYFIPHKENDHKPHILRTKATLVIICFLMVSELVFLAGAGLFTNYERFFAAILSGVLVDETNSNRISQNMPTLTVSPILEKAAREKAEDMSRFNYFAHVGPDGKTPWEWLKEVGYDYRYAGENLAVNFIDSKDVVYAWMNSPGHRANILNNNYTEIGIGTATGTYRGRETVFIAQYFGRPLINYNQNNLDSTPTPVATSIQLIQNTPSQTIIVETVTSPSPIQETTTTLAPNSVLSENIISNTFDKAQEEQFIAIINPDALNVTNNEITNTERAIYINQSSAIERTLSSPRSTVSYLFIIIATIISFALALKIFIKIEIQHPPLIFNAILLLVIIVSALAINKYIGFISAQIL